MRHTFKVIPFNNAGECDVIKTVYVDVPEEQSLMKFLDTSVSVKQSQEELKLKLLRTESTQGDVEVSWMTKSEVDLFNGIKGR